jgi:hypothetical protein
MTWVARVFTIYAHCDTVDQPSSPATPIWLSVPSWAHDSTTLTPCCMAYHRRTSFVFSASKMRWLGASWTVKFTGVRMRCYNNYTGCLYPSAYWLQTCEAGVPRSLIRHQFVPELISYPISAIPYAPLSRNLPARYSRTKTVFGSRAFRVAAPTVFNCLPQDITSTDNISPLCPLLQKFYFRKAFD